MAAHSDDVVNLDVGGAPFRSSVLTLSSNSRYFESIFRKEWETSTVIFLDQEPVHFAVLLEYMRQGCIEVEKLNIGVVLLAEFLGIDKLIAAMKCIAYCNLNPEFSDSDEDAVVAFDGEFHSIQSAVSRGILPQFLMRKKPSGKEYAMIEVDGEYVVRYFNLNTVDFLSTVLAPCRPHHGRVEEADELLDCLNWLSKNGFRYFEDDESSRMARIMYTGLLPQLIFSFSRPAGHSRPLSDLRTLIIDKARTTDCAPRKKYAIMLQIAGSFAVKADVGETREFGVPNELVAASRYTFPVANASCIEALTWLDQEGYTERENELFEKVFVKICSIAISEDADEVVEAVQLFSKTILNNEE